ncbi:MAG: MFS transporter [Gemmatimonadota bacterium]
MQSGISQAFESTIVRVAIGAIAAALLYVLVQEVRKIPGRLIALMATAFLDMVGLLMIIPILPFYVKDLAGEGVPVFGLHLEVGLLSGIIVAAFTVAQLVSAPLWGRFSDRHGRRPALMIALGASAVAYIIFGFATSLWVLFLSRIVQGAGGGTVGVIQAYVADTTEPADRARALGWLSAATNLGVALGPVLGAFSVKLGPVDLMPGGTEITMGRAAPGIVAALMCLITMTFAWRYLAESRHEHETTGQPRRRSREAVLRVLSHSGEPASRLILIYAIAIGSFQGVNSILALFLNARFGVSAETIGYFFMYIGAISVFTRVLLLGRLVDRLGEPRLSRVGIVLLASGLLGMPLSSNLPMLALAVALIPLGTAFTFPCVTALLSRVTHAAERGLYMGVQQTFGGASRVVAPLFYGWAFDALGVASPYYFAAVFVFATIFLGLDMEQYVKPRAETARV